MSPRFSAYDENHISRILDAEYLVLFWVHALLL